MQILKAYRIRIYPDDEQSLLFARTIGCVRALKNAAREQRLTWSRNGQWINYGNQAAELGVLKPDLPYFSEVPFHCLQQALKDVQTAFERWRKGLGQRPKPIRKGNRETFRFPDPKQFSVLFDQRQKGWGWLKLPKAGKVRARLHRPIQGRLLSVTISREGAWWYAAIQAEVYKPGRWNDGPYREEEVGGADIGIAQPVSVSAGLDEQGHPVGDAIFTMPRISPEEMRRKARLQKSISRKT